MLFNPATITAVVFILAAEITRRKLNSTRMASLVLFTCAFVALVVYTVVGIWFRGPNWEFFWSSGQWPVQ